MSKIKVYHDADDFMGDGMGADFVLKYDYDIAVEKHLSLGLTCDRLSDEKHEFKKQIAILEAESKECISRFLHEERMKVIEEKAALLGRKLIKSLEQRQNIALWAYDGNKGLVKELMVPLDLQLSGVE